MLNEHDDADDDAFDLTPEAELLLTACSRISLSRLLGEPPVGIGNLVTEPDG
ncbi:hypothetical protein [Sphingomonas panni]|uniref:hypothetical protein n=1 Tax=Sphingomonas panni TaxID=237612 RepID=UPI001F5B46CB|nr:hypothetical protein [Sphingomonas panni]